eukprot:CAMPEP_0183719642 /NCGR_PEP_ID=MMETSP0737-20130205/12490_1 /TAXON_ID=385413 /ORGANISM="Thalassiosira miniscula, Strain CCMP1093" /LENGTH=240 /DNA_ID=CAMNT_0025949367 /DNA_START=83 /DNA_END=801 /DNA_ORIENTATION=+
MKSSLDPSLDHQEHNNGNESVMKKRKTEVPCPSTSGKVLQDDDNSSIQSALFDVAIILPDDMACDFPLPLVSIELPHDQFPLSIGIPASATWCPSDAAADTTLKRGAALSTSIAYLPVAVPNTGRSSHVVTAPKPKNRKVNVNVSMVSRAPKEVVKPPAASFNTDLAANGSIAVNPSTIIKTVKPKEGLKASTSDLGESTGRWSSDEHHLFLRGLELYGQGKWGKIAALVRTRTPVQVRT